MSAFRASLMMLKIGDGEISETFTTIGGLRQYDLRINQQLLDATDLNDGAWRNIQNNAGMRTVRISGSGLYTDSESEQQLNSAALTSVVANYQCYFSNGDILQGPFIVQEYYRGGSIESEEIFRIALESAGELQLL